MDISHIRITNDDYMAMPNDGKRYELHDGILVEMPSATVIHALIVSFLIATLHTHIRGKRLGYITPDNLDFILNEGLIVKPDVSFVSASRFEGPIPDYFHFAPDLAVEVLSPSNSASEITYKISTYLRYGTQLIWIVDPLHRTVMVHTSGEENTIVARVLSVDDVLTGSSLLPDLRLPVREIFNEIEAL